jgi:eukaryotic-like serine/threonine-protein kinase
VGPARAPTSRRPLRSWRLAAVLVAALAGATVLRLMSGAEPDLSPSTVAVFPFTFHGGPAWEYLGEGMVKLLSTTLDGEAGLRAVDPRALHSTLEHEGRHIWDPQRGPAVAARLGAGAYVLGHIVEAEGRLRITASLYQAGERGARRAAEVTVEGEGASIFALVDRLTAQLLARSGAARQLAGVAARTTESPAALLAFLEGESELLGGRTERAADAFRRAVEADTTFALAYYGLSRAAHWLVHTGGSDEGAEGALRHGDRLGPLDRVLVRAWDFYRRGEAIPADSLYRAVLRQRPDDVEAWLHLGEVGFHYGPMIGRPAAESREAFERVLAYESDNVGAMIHLARLAASAGELARLDSLTQQILAREPGPYQALLVGALRSVAHDEPSLPDDVRAALDHTPFLPLKYATLVVAADTRNLTRAAAFAREVALRQQTPTDRAWAKLMEAQLELARGRWSVARVVLDEVGRLVPDWEAEFRAALLTFPLLQAPATEYAAAYDALTRAPGEVPSLRWRGSAQRRHYLLALLGARRGDGDAVRRHREALEGFAGAALPVDSAFSRRLALDLRAQLAAGEGRTEEALTLLGPPDLPPDRARPALTSYYKADERWLRAELLRTLGRDPEALRVFASFPDPDAYDLVYLAPSHLRRAEIHERRGERAEAAAHYRRFLDLWRDADPELRPLVAAARQRLEALGPSTS